MSAQIQWFTIPGAKSLDAETYTILRNGAPIVGAVYFKHETVRTHATGIDPRAPPYPPLPVRAYYKDEDDGWVGVARRRRHQAQF